MQHTRLIETLRTCTPRERLRFQAFIHSDYFNKHQVLRKLSSYIDRFAPGYDDAGLEKRSVFAELFGPQATYRELQLNNLISDLYELLLQFIGTSSQAQNSLDRQRQVVESLLKRNLDKQAARALEQFRMMLDRRPDRTAEWHRFEVQWWEAAEVLHSRQPKRSVGEHLQRQMEATALFQQLERLRIRMAFLSRQGLAVVRGDVGSAATSFFSDLVNPPEFIRIHPPVQVYESACLLLEKPEKASYDALVAGLYEHYRLFKPGELSPLYQCALNYCIRRINDGESDAYRDALDLYRTLIDRNLLLSDGSLSKWTYKNIATTGMRSGEFDWTEDFLLQYRDFLFPADRDNAFAFNLASLFFERQDYASTLQALRDVEFPDITYHLGAKILQLKCFYLLGEEEALKSLIESTRQLIRRNADLSPYGKTTNLNFLKMLRKVAGLVRPERRAVFARQAKKRNELLQRIREVQPMANKDWLVKYLEEG
jgi:hypothetical protein